MNLCPSVAQKRGLDLGLKQRWSLAIGKNLGTSSPQWAVLGGPQGRLVALSRRIWAGEGPFGPEVGCALPGSGLQKRKKRRQPGLPRAWDLGLSTFYCNPRGLGPDRRLREKPRLSRGHQS